MTSPQVTLDLIERYCRMVRKSALLGADETAADVLDLIERHRQTGRYCGVVGHNDGCGCHLTPIPPPVESLNPSTNDVPIDVSIWEEAAS